MGAFAGVEPTWASQTDVGRTHIATKGIVQSGLVLNLDAGVSNSYPGSGTTWIDLSNSGTNGILTNGPTYISTNGGSLLFDGVDDYVEMTSDLLLGIDFSLSIIYKQTNIRSDWVRLFGHSNNSTDRFWGIWMPTSRNYILWQSYKNGGQIVTPTYNFNLNQTYFIDVTCSGSIKNFYINGSFFYSASSGGTIDYTGNNSKIRLGYAGFHTYHVGDFYSAKIYNKVLTPQEIQQNYNATKSRYINN